ncbi:hypothetical protein M3649_02115 [Ureibacillus chungkukjangi]|uniref:hypothetical protein n=1 Tax=Ureibacillus chungkukjangi TaxID=1202712 RepID=UPI00203BAF20|nr:hypothetical protein [Ureibacillus chungkukjangi]MCM3386923.1 hypothetical protein [Ureibacillus chungkukjangi]
MKKNKIFVTSLLVGLLVISAACGNSSEKTTDQDQPEVNKESSDSSLSSEISTAITNPIASENSDVNVDNDDSKNLLSQYSSEQIEYARVWLQLGPNQEIDELNVRKISAGEPINPDDETSANYPEDVIQLAGSRLVDGSVTYSGNGDGTINVYNVPLRWDGNYPAGEEFYNDIIENTKQVYIETGNDDKIIALIKLQIVHQ